MNKTVTFRLDPETARILKELTARGNGSRTQAIKEALRAHREAIELTPGPTAWEAYCKLRILKGRGPKRDQASSVSKLLREKLRAKHRAGSL